MPGVVTTEAAREALARAVERNILQHTSRSMHRLRVDVGPDGVHIEGWAPSYYVHQLAVQAVQKALAAKDVPVELDIQVGGGETRPPQGHSPEGGDAVPQPPCRPCR
jgi:hypothetical protein